LKTKRSGPRSATGVNGPLVALLAGACVVLGGGGSPAPLPELALQCLTAGIMALIILSPERFAALLAADRRAWVLAGFVAILPLLQLIPLPPALWQALPGRAIERDSLALIGAADTWQPWSMAPARTLAALLAVLPPALLIVLTASLPRKSRVLVVTAIALAALLGLVIGVGQLAGGESSAMRFYTSNAGYLTGFQANRNSTADMLLIGMIASIAVWRGWAERLPRRYRLGVVALICLLFILGVVLTGSRAGTALLPVALLGVAAIVWPWLAISRRTLLGLVGVAGIALIIAIIAARDNMVLARVLSRYDFTGEARPEIWRDSLYAMQQYFPWGAGMGTFIPVFQAAERLEVVTFALPNRAHNDGLELMIEAGAFGLAVLLAACAILSHAAWQALRNPPGGARSQVIFSVASMAVIALHSQVDYPLRSMSLACVAAVCAGLLMQVPGRGKPGNDLE